MKALQAEVDSATMSVDKKDKCIASLKSEKKQLQCELQSMTDTNFRNKLLLTVELEQLKKLKEVTSQDLDHKTKELLNMKRELERTSITVKEKEEKIRLLEAQLKWKVQHQQSTEAELAKKRAELLEAQASLYCLEEKHLTSTGSIQEHIAKELREEIRHLRMQLTERQLSGEEDDYVKSKLAENCRRLTKENAQLLSQITEVSKQLEKFHALRNEDNMRKSSSITELASLKDQERQLEWELANWKRSVNEEKMKVLQSMAELHDLEQVKSSAQEKRASLGSLLSELEGKYSKIHTENAEIRGEKVQLVDYISQLNKQIFDKEEEIRGLKNHTHTLSNDLSSLRC
nr:PREDICTED: citron Rho-interacting kinase-like isoform X2 [Lepisosteus oculatus]